ncbi:MAG: hypothetical protein ACYTG0_11510 [Planctomycetota bacterium]|jgi:hypothetical protein
MSNEPDRDRPEPDPEVEIEEVEAEAGIPTAEDSQVAPPAPAAAGPARKKPIMPPSRIALLVFVIAAAVVIVIEWNVRSAYTRTVNDLQAALDEGLQTPPGLDREGVEEHIHGSPSREYDEENRIETLTWKGLLNTHSLEIAYERSDLVGGIRTPED